jgi:hypothetical protein
MRKLCSIQTVKSIKPIENADFIVEIEVLGWHLVAKKGEFNIGDKCIFYEIDSKLKPIEAYDFMSSRKYKVKTVKFKNTISQGLALPISILSQKDVLEDGWSYSPETNKITSVLKDVELLDGVDLTDILGIEKYDLEEGESLQSTVKFKINPKKSKFYNKISYWKWKIQNWFKRFNTKSKGGSFPTHLCPKTDQTRYQTFNDETKNSIKGKVFQKEEKIDGSSLTVIKHNKNFIVCSRNLALAENKQDNFWKAVYMYDMKNKLKKYGKNIALQMELIGEGIQGNRYNIKGVDVKVFDIYDIDKKQYLSPQEFLKVCKDLELPTVPIIDENFILSDETDVLVNSSIKNSVLNTKAKQEGFVFKLKEDGKRFSFKIINPEYLLEKDKKSN